MHTLHFDSRQRLRVGLVALVVTLVLVMVAAPLGQLDLASDGGSGGAASAPAAPTVAPHRVSRERARWATDPLASPIELLVRPAGA